MHALYPIADYQYEVERRQDEMAAARQAHLAHQCLDCKKSKVNLPASLLNFLWLLLPLFRR